MDETITFGDGLLTLSDYEAVGWQILERHRVEFFPGVFYDVVLVSTETQNFEKFLTDSIYY